MSTTLWLAGWLACTSPDPTDTGSDSTADDTGDSDAWTSACGDFFPYDRAGSEWSWSQSEDIYPNDWTVTLGTETWEGQALLVVRRDGLAELVTGETQIWWDEALVSCDESGIWQHYVRRQDTYQEEGQPDQVLNTETEYEAAWLLWPRTLEVGTTWTREGTQTYRNTDTGAEETSEFESALEITDTTTVTTPAGTFQGALVLDMGAFQATLAPGAGALQVTTGELVASQLTAYSLGD